jgi:predicted nucleotidyltransferase
MSVRIEVPAEEIAAFCRRHCIRKLAFFGSAQRDDFTPESDVDALVEFEPGARVGLIGFAGVQNELSRQIGRKVDLNTPGFLSPYFRDEALQRRRPPTTRHDDLISMRQMLGYARQAKARAQGRNPSDLESDTMLQLAHIRQTYPMEGTKRLVALACSLILTSNGYSRGPSHASYGVRQQPVRRGSLVCQDKLCPRLTAPAPRPI